MKDRSRRKSRMDARTRERLPVLPALASQVAAERADTAGLRAGYAPTTIKHTLTVVDQHPASERPTYGGYPTAAAIAVTEVYRSMSALAIGSMAIGVSCGFAVGGGIWPRLNEYRR